MSKTISGTLHFEIELDTPDGDEQQQQPQPGATAEEQLGMPASPPDPTT